MEKTLLAVILLAGCGGQGGQRSDADTDADTDTATGSGSDTHSDTGSDTGSGSETDSATETISETTTDSSTESGTGCDLTEPGLCESEKFDARSDVSEGAFFDVAEFCVPEDDACALEQVAAWAPAVTCSAVHKGIIVCAAGELDCDWNFSETISAADYDALCDLSTIDVITQIRFMVWVL